MLLSIEYRGQLALAAKGARATCDVAPGTAVTAVLRALTEHENDHFRELVLAADGACGAALFVAIDGEHVPVDETAMVPEGAREMVIMPPIAGG
jgi:hypothetical protein